ncbi:PAAR domain-containing protein [Aeromonas hydrophila]|uniref:PAAR domain-containing protein n=1 Tax=Aeromonas hydrophila TaxID=644 RepID=UPI001F22D231|nr:PAAR domain-containing protein [Aeromonas hydrophila]
MASGSSTVFVNSKPLAMTGSSVDCGGVIIGAGTVIVGVIRIRGRFATTTVAVEPLTRS